MSSSPSPLQIESLEIQELPDTPRRREIVSALKSSGTIDRLVQEQEEIQTLLFPTDEVVDEMGRDVRYNANIALAFYNHKHGTKYEVVCGICLKSNSCMDITFLHCSFLAAADQSVSSTSVPVRFLAVLLSKKPSDREIVLSCCIIDSAKSIGCISCDPHPAFPLWGYSPANLSAPKKTGDEERLPRIALAHYNKKHNEIYEFVEELGTKGSVGVDNAGIVAHCNFTATRGDDESSTKLFFAELIQVKINVWKVLACRILGNKTNAGCHMCQGNTGKKIQHPCGKFRYGLHEYKSRSLRQGQVPGRGRP